MTKHGWMSRGAASAWVLAACSCLLETGDPGSSGPGNNESSSGGGSDRSVCDKAIDHAEQCLPDEPSTGSAALLPCEGAYVCGAACVNAASCDALAGRDAAGRTALLACVDDCGITLP